MDVQDRVQLAMALSNGEAVGQVAIAGIWSICIELTRLGALDAAAVERIRAFMLQTLERSAASANLRSMIVEATELRFDDAAEWTGKQWRPSNSTQ